MRLAFRWEFRLPGIVSFPELIAEAVKRSAEPAVTSFQILIEVDRGVTERKKKWKNEITLTPRDFYHREIIQFTVHPCKVVPVGPRGVTHFFILSFQAPKHFLNTFFS